MPALVSTGGLYALTDRSDAGHKASVGALAQVGGALVVLAPVLTETVALSERLLGPEAGEALLRAVVEGDLLFQPLEAPDWASAQVIRRGEAGLSLTGALVVAAAQRLGVEAVLCREPAVRRAAVARRLQVLPEE